MKHIVLPCAAIASLLLVFSCKSEKRNEEVKQGYTEVRKAKSEETISINENLIAVNRDVIEKYISRHKWQMEETETGLYYMVYSKTEGEKVQSGDEVEFAFKTSLLNGDVLYDSDATGNRRMVIDKNQEESGLNEGLKLMRKGEKAYFILPPHLAFGVAGDSYKIAPYSVLVYDIEVVGIKQPTQDLYGDVVL
ncbi:MAG: FKBP-type peptidyl-prolyl cis-trans isomerase [Bacteroidales bacterium]|nr:FKBP-type peptidyl-prolyl cis-trans isomerase [Bacteroidales bacterium]